MFKIKSLFSELLIFLGFTGIATVSVYLLARVVLGV